MMTLEWLRRRDATLDRMMRTYLFTEGSVLAVEEEAEHGGVPEPAGAVPAPAPADGSLGLGLGSLRAAAIPGGL